jgi:hypothetical protein
MRPILMVSKANSSSIVFPAILKLRRFSAVTAMINMTIPIMRQRTLLASLVSAGAVTGMTCVEALVGRFKRLSSSVRRTCGVRHIQTISELCVVCRYQFKKFYEILKCSDPLTT